MIFRIGHFSDLHLGPLPPGAAFKSFCAKRLIGALSWHMNRKSKHSPVVAEALRQDVMAAGLDHIAFTGDAANVASPLEFPKLRSWMDSLATPDQLSYTPGNHDAYVPVAHERGLKFFEPFMSSDMRDDREFPFVRLRRNIALVGLNSAIPRFWHSAQGRLGLAQRERLRLRLTELKAKGFYRVVMIHHPPAPGLATHLRSLIDAKEVAQILSEQQVELVIHGHNHKRELHWLKTGQRPVPIIGVPSASMGAQTHHPAEWNCYDISRLSGQWQTEVTIRRWNGVAFEPASTFRLEA